MNSFTNEELNNALQIVAATISRCEKMFPKFAEGTAQHSLLKNRIKALRIAQSLIIGERDNDQHSKDDLINALAPLSSMISKCMKAQQKHMAGTPYYTRYKNIIETMNIAQIFIKNEIDQRE